MNDLTERAVAVVEAIESGDYGGEGEQLADRLILAVRAELPCYHEWSYWNITKQCDEGLHVARTCVPGIPLCPSCEARAALKETRGA